MTVDASSAEEKRAGRRVPHVNSATRHATDGEGLRERSDVMLYRLHAAALAVTLMAMVGCGSVEQRPIVLIEPEYSYLRAEANAKPLTAPTSRRVDAPLTLSAANDVSLTANRLP